MDDSAATLPLVMLAGAALLFLLDLALTVALVAVSALSRVALQQLSGESSPRFDFLMLLKTPSTTHRTATYIARQWSLLGGVLLLVLAARSADWRYPGVAGVVFGALAGVLLLEGLLARGLGLRHPRRALRMTGPLIWIVHAALYPLVLPLNRLLERSSRRRAMADDDRDEVQEQEVEALIEVGEREGILEADEGKMMRSIADLDETLVREIMTPRTDIVSLPVESTVAHARKVLIESAHSKLPVYRKTIDNVVGVLHARDLFRAWEEKRQDAGITPFLRPALFVPETITVAELLSTMRLKTHIAMVVDEYGGIAGLVTMEDLVEEIVGDIRDEHDEVETLVSEQADGTWLISGVVHVNELESMFGVEVGDRDFDTVGGLVVAGFGRVPKRGETLRVHGMLFEVVESNSKRVYRVRVRRVEDADADSLSAGA